MSTTRFIAPLTGDLLDLVVPSRTLTQESPTSFVTAAVGGGLLPGQNQTFLTLPGVDDANTVCLPESHGLDSFKSATPSSVEFFVALGAPFNTGWVSDSLITLLQHGYAHYNPPNVGGTLQPFPYYGFSVTYDRSTHEVFIQMDGTYVYSGYTTTIAPAPDMLDGTLHHVVVTWVDSQNLLYVGIDGTWVSVFSVTSGGWPGYGMDDPQNPTPLPYFFGPSAYSQTVDTPVGVQGVRIRIGDSPYGVPAGPNYTVPGLADYLADVPSTAAAHAVVTGDVGAWRVWCLRKSDMQVASSESVTISTQGESVPVALGVLDSTPHVLLLARDDSTPYQISASIVQVT